MPAIVRGISCNSKDCGQVQQHKKSMNNIIKRLGRSAKVFKSAAIAFTLKALLLGLVCQESQAFTASPTPRMAPCLCVPKGPV